jgi:23S rRNA (uracil1939-C5)-methyltransferase
MKLHIDYVNEFGLGVARDPKGQRIFVPYTLPEENVTILSIKNQGKFLLAALGSIDKSSLVRQTPPCPYYGYCGGCSLQHMNYEFYKDFKKNIVKKALDKLGYEYSALVSREFFVDYGQRRRTVFRAYIKNRALIFGYFAPRTNEIVEIADCLLLKPQINAAIDIIKNV